MADNIQVTENSFSDSEARARTEIGKHVLYISLIIVSLLGLCAIASVFYTEENAKKFSDIKDVLTIILPLIGTWVGTVLAFYFSRENYAAAAQQATNLLRQLTPEQRLESIPVTDAMLDMSADTTLKLFPPSNDPGLVNIKKDIVDFLENHQRNRLPVVDSTGKIIYIIHLSLVYKFLSKQFIDQTQKNSLTLNDLLQDASLTKIFKAFAIVGKNARLSAVKQLIDGNPDCSDAFVTEDGTGGSKAVGWITNVIVQEKSVA